MTGIALRRLALALGTATLMPLAACGAHGDDQGREVAATGTGTTRTYPATGFSEIALRGADDVEVRVGGGFSVRAEGPGDELDTVRVAIDDGTLLIGRRGRDGGGPGDGRKVKLFVTLPRLTEANLLGSGDMTVDRVEGARFDTAIAGSGTLSLAALAVDEAEVSVAGSGDAQLAGTARHLTINVAGSGNVRAAGLRSQGATVSVAGSGDVTARVAGPATISALGSGDVDLGPEARCTTTKVGSSTVRCGG